MLGQSLSSLKILEQLLQNKSVTEYAISLLVLVTSTALSSLNFFQETYASDSGSGTKSASFDFMKFISFGCAIIFLVESLAIFLLTIGVPSFANYFPVFAVYFAIIVVPLRKLLDLILDGINLYNQSKGPKNLRTQ